MSFLKRIRRKGRSINHQDLHFRASVPSPTLECAKDKCLSDKKETIREESRSLSRPKSLENFRKEKRNGNVTRGAACSTEATKANTALLAPLSDAVGDDRIKKERKARADTKGDRPKAASCQSRNKNKRSRATTVSSRAPPPPPPTSSKPSVSQPGPTQSSSSRPTPVRPAPPPPRPPRTRPARPPPPTIKQCGKSSATANKGPSSDKEKENEICQFSKDLNPFANSSSNTSGDRSSQKSEKASSTRRQRHKRRRKSSKSGEYPTENNPFNHADEMSEKLSSTRRQRRRRKREESKNEEFPMEDNSSCDTHEGSSSILESTASSDMWSVSSLEDIQVVMNTTTKEKENVKTPLQVLAASDEKDEQVDREDSAQSFPSGNKVSPEGGGSSILESTENSDMWSVSSLEDIQFVVNTAAIEELNMKTALLGLAARDEKVEQFDRQDSAQSFPFGNKVSPEGGGSSILESTENSDMWSVSSLEDIQFVVNTAAIEELNMKTALLGLAASDEKVEQFDRQDSAQSFPFGNKVSPEGGGSSILESTETSDMWSVSSLEDIQFVVNTAAIEELNMKTALLGLAARDEKVEQFDRQDSAQSFPSGNKVSPQGGGSSILESTENSDMWSVSSLEDIQFVVNTAAIEELNMKTALLGLAARDEKVEQVDRQDSAQSFPSGNKVSPQGGGSSILESTETSDMWSVSSLEDIQFVVNTAAIEELNMKTALLGLAARDEKVEQVDREDSAQSFPSGNKVSPQGGGSSILESTETSDMWSVSSLEDIQFVVNTAAIEELNMKTALLGLAANEGLVDRKNAGDSRAQSFPSGEEVSSVDAPSTTKDNDFASIGLTNLDASTAKDFTDVDERPILKQPTPSEEASTMEESQGGDSSAFGTSNQCPELAIYVDAELQVVESEMLSLQKVMVKLELEMKEAMDTEDCEAEFESLSLDWLALNKFGSDLDRRKQELLTLSKQENRKECLKFLREDLKCLFEVKGWKKTSEHKAQEKNVLDVILKLTNMA